MKYLIALLVLAFATPIDYRKTYKIKANDLYYLDRLIWVESRNDPKAKSKIGAVGLMQITKPVLDDYYTFGGVHYTMDEMTDPKKNMEVGIWQLRRLKKYYGCDIKTVSAYNLGIGNTDNGIINFQFTFLILGTNRVTKWLDGRKVTPWRGTKTCYIVEGL